MGHAGGSFPCEQAVPPALRLDDVERDRDCCVEIAQRVRTARQRVGPRIAMRSSTLRGCSAVEHGRFPDCGCPTRLISPLPLGRGSLRARHETRARGKELDSPIMGFWLRSPGGAESGAR